MDGRKSTYPDEVIRPCPLILYGYGSYGVCIEPDFENSRVTMLDRGVAWAIAHIRGRPSHHVMYGEWATAVVMRMPCFSRWLGGARISCPGQWSEAAKKEDLIV